MIFVAVGTQKFPLNRLLCALDELISQGSITEAVFAQTGHSTYLPEHYESQAFLSKESFEENIQNCDLLITHSGVATIVAGLKRNKPVIVVPRLAKYAEHVDDHQIQIAESFSEQNFVIMCSDTANLAACIVEAKRHEFDHYVSQRKRMLETIQQYLMKNMKK